LRQLPAQLSTSNHGKEEEASKERTQRAFDDPPVAKSDDAQPELKIARACSEANTCTSSSNDGARSKSPHPATVFP